MRRCWPARPAAGCRAAGAAPPIWWCIWPTGACAATTAAWKPAIPRACPDCGNLDIHPFGRGTQRLEAALVEHFPEARILRIDRDSASTPKKWQAMLDAIHAGEADILVGTQMLAKGHDFPRLTLVGVVGADAALFAADFRAPERLFSQLMQVGGRSGRAALPGEVLIQTEYPEHPLYRALVGHDYDAFARAQLAERGRPAFRPSPFRRCCAPKPGTSTRRWPSSPRRATRPWRWPAKRLPSTTRCRCAWRG